MNRIVIIDGSEREEERWRETHPEITAPFDQSFYSFNLIDLLIIIITTLLSCENWTAPKFLFLSHSDNTLRFIREPTP